MQLTNFQTPQSPVGAVAGRAYKSLRSFHKRRKMRRESKYLPPTSGQIEILLNFPDGPINLYQVRQWYGPLEHLANRHTVGILCFQPDSARIIARETSLKVILTAGHTNLAEIEQSVRPKIILYPNQNYSNYRILGLTSSEHIFICHGESDKIYMASNWIKIFNYFFVAGQASRERLRRHVRNYDVAARTIEIGRPQIDLPAPAPIPKPDNRITVLYAPTWEGGRTSMCYGSVASHGVAMISRLVADPRFAVIYRPHPRTGVRSPEFAAADESIRRMIADAAEPAIHLVDDSPFGWQLDIADVMISDVSAVTYDWLTTGKPILVTKPLEPEAVMPEEGFLADLPTMSSQDATSVVETLIGILDDDDLLRTYSRWADHYYGDRTPGASLRRFEVAIDRVLCEQGAATTRGLTPDGPTQKIDPVGEVKRRSFPMPSLPAFQRSRDLLRATRRAFRKDQDAALAARTRIPVDDGRTWQIVVTAMGEPEQLDWLRHNLPDLALINRTHSVTVLVGNRGAYDSLASCTDLPIAIADSATTAEEIFNAVAPVISIHFDQAKLNLREATHRAMTHVYIGEIEDRSWINNRLRLFDVVIHPEEISSQSIVDELIDFPETIDFVPWGPESAAPTLASAVRSVADDAFLRSTKTKR